MRAYRRLVTIALLAPLVPALLAASCRGRSETRVDDIPEEESISRSVSFSTDQSKAALQRGREHVLEQRFAEAVTEFRAVYQRRSAKPEYRAEALHQLGLVHSHLMNPRRDPDEALHHLRLLVDEFPDSELVPRALEKIASLEARSSQPAP